MNLHITITVTDTVADDEDAAAACAWLETVLRDNGYRADRITWAWTQETTT